VCVVAYLLIDGASGLADDRSAQQGWATVGEGTTGGAGGAEFLVSTAEEFVEAIQGDAPKIIRIAAEIKLGEAVRLTSNTTLVGTGPKAMITGGGLHLRRVHNVIIQDLVIAKAADAIGIEESHHVWIDHCDLSNCRDGLIDIKRGSDFITVSWNHFHDHHKTCLLGHSDKQDVREMDRGHLRVTYHHNFFDGTKTRHPRVRFAEGVHVFNNYFRKNEYGVASVMDAGVIVESNVFEDVEHPTLVAYGDSPEPGRLAERDNLLIRSGKPDTRGVVDDSGLHYKYTIDAVTSIQTSVAAEAGPRHKVADAQR
jgi:pectate lyase